MAGTQLVLPIVPSSATERPIGVIIVEAFHGGRGIAAGGGTTITKGEFTTNDNAASLSAIIITVVVVVAPWATPYARAFLPKDPHIEGRDAMVPEVEGGKMYYLSPFKLATLGSLPA